MLFVHWISYSLDKADENPTMFASILLKTKPKRKIFIYFDSSPVCSLISQYVAAFSVYEERELFFFFTFRQLIISFQTVFTQSSKATNHWLMDNSCKHSRKKASHFVPQPIFFSFRCHCKLLVLRRFEF